MVKSFTLTPLIFLVIASVVFYQKAELFIEKGEELLANADFEHGLESWTKKDAQCIETCFSVQQNRLELYSKTGCYCAVFQPMQAPAGKIIRAKAKLATQNVIAGEKAWEKARVYVVTREKSGPWRWDLKHSLVLLHGTHSQKEYQLLLRLPEEVTELRFSISLHNASGKMWIDNVSLMQVVKNEPVQLLAYGMMGLWLLWLLWCIWPWVQQKQYWVIFSVGVVVLLLMLMPQEYKQQLITNFEGYSWFSGEESIAAIGHFISFALLTLTVMWVKKGCSIKSIILLAMFACFTELLQFFALERTTQWHDFIVNMAGIITGSLFCGLFYFFYQRRQSD